MINTGLICSGCANSRRDTWQKNNSNTLIKTGGHVQLGVSVEGVTMEGKPVTEHMWFRVIDVVGTQVTGELNNDPIMLPVVCGATFIFDRSQIENYITPKTKQI